MIEPTRIARVLVSLMASLVIGSGCGESVNSPPEREDDPDPGSLLISAVTTGADPDSDGFLVTVGGQQAHPLPNNGSLLFDSLAPGAYQLRVLGISNNCSPVADQTVTVASGQRTTVELAITCVERVGIIRITGATTGFDQPANGYLIELDSGATAARVPTNGTVTLRGVREGAHLLTLGDIPSHCSIEGAADRTIHVDFSAMTVVAFGVQCATGPVTVRFSVATSGTDLDLDGYEARVEPSMDVPTGFATPIASSGKAEIVVSSASVPTRLHVVLRGVAPNCTAVAKGWLGPTAFVDVASTTLDMEYTVNCESLTPRPLPAGGRLAFVRQNGIHLVNTDGTGLVELTRGWLDRDPAWSPDGKRIAFVRRAAGSQSVDLYIMDADGANLARLTTGRDLDSPSWSPDGTRIAVSGSIGDDRGILEIDAAGTARTMVTDNTALYHPAWSPDGGTIAFVSDRDAWDWGSNVFLSSISGANITRLTNLGRPIPTYAPMFFRPAWAPDGRRLAAAGCPVDYQLCDTSLIYLLELGGGQRPLAAGRGGARATWSPDGRTIVYDSGGALRWIRADGTDRGLLILDGHSPAWRP